MPDILNPNIEIRNSKQIQNSNFQMFKTETKGQLWSSLGFGHSDFEHSNLFRASCFGFRISDSMLYALCPMLYALCLFKLAIRKYFPIL